MVELFDLEPNTILLFSGIGFEGFDTLDENIHGLHSSLNTLNINFGIEYRIDIKIKSKFTGQKIKIGFFYIRAPFSLLFYDNTLGTNLSGNAIMIEMGIGGLLML